MTEQETVQITVAGQEITLGITPGTQDAYDRWQDAVSDMTGKRSQSKAQRGLVMTCLISPTPPEAQALFKRRPAAVTLAFAKLMPLLGLEAEEEGKE